LDHERLETAIELDQSGDNVAAFEIWSNLAEGGSVWAMTELGNCYQFGKAVPEDLSAAERWFARAATGGSLLAMIYRAKCAGYREDYATAVEALRPGVDQGWISALFWQSWYRQKLSPTLKTYRGILPLLKRATREGHPGATWIMANWMAWGKFGWWLIPVGHVRLLLGAVKEACPPPQRGMKT
jgi:TPR repeat protein